MKFEYDAWNRMTKVIDAYRDGGGTLQSGSTIATLSYDGKGRRIGKAIANDADLDTTYAFYHDGDSVIETRNGSSYVLKQQVWGTQYIDELVQVGVNHDPSNASTGISAPRRENLCERFFWACQDSNYNVLGLVYSTGVLAERYEYTPYGKRTVYSRGWLMGDLDDDGLRRVDHPLTRPAAVAEPTTAATLALSILARRRRRCSGA